MAQRERRLHLRRPRDRRLRSLWPGTDQREQSRDRHTADLIHRQWAAWQQFYPGHPFPFEMLPHRVGIRQAA
jgi:hypothetical protein